MNFMRVDTEGFSMRLPRDEILRVVVGHIFKHVLQLDRKGKLRTEGMLEIDEEG